MTQNKYTVINGDVMSPQDFYLRMLSIENDEDSPEIRHIDADKLICNLLKELGYEDGVRIFEGWEKWYS